MLGALQAVLLGAGNSLSHLDRLIALFKNGEKGGLYVIKDDTVFSDEGGTTPATNGGLCKYIKDLSGNGNHVTTSATTITYSNSSTPRVTFSSASVSFAKASAMSLKSEMTSACVSCIPSGSGAIATNRHIGVLKGSTNYFGVAARQGVMSGSSVLRAADVSVNSYSVLGALSTITAAAPYFSVAVHTGGVLSCSVNGETATTISTGYTSGEVSGATLNINSYYANQSFWCGLVVDRALTTSEIALVRSAFNSYGGIA